MHIDMNSYFASVEQQANPFLRGKPIGITGKQQKRSIIAAASIEAKKRGVKTAMSTWEAKKICPSLIVYPGDPEKYSDVMHRFNRIYQEFTDRVEEFSVDESFLDLSEQTTDYLGAACIALSIRERLKQELGECLTASIGIASNKLMAKLSSECIKPNGLTVTPPDRVLDLLDRSALQDLCGIGPRREQHLNALGIYTFEQLRHFPLEMLVKKFKREGFWLKEAAWGREGTSLSTVNETVEKLATCRLAGRRHLFNVHFRTFQRLAGPRTDISSSFSTVSVNRLQNSDPKSYGHSYTLAYDTKNPKEMKRYLLGLADRVAWRMRRDGCTAKRISVYVRYGDFSSMGQQLLLNEPTANGLTLYKTAWRMIETWRDDKKSLRLLGLSASHLLPSDEPQSLFKKERKLHSLQHSLDTLQHRYGMGIWTRASLLEVKLKARSSGFHFDHEL